ncbi:MAG: YbaK/EbsC family protein [Gammaproteobacteria bacterium]|nr:YbaK/EbsC family protein [Gammaproteobacteria bacterium]
MPADKSSQRVQQALLAHGLTCVVQELSDSTRTAADAAAALGCEVAQIAKSLVFKDAADGTALLIIASGANRVDEARVGELLSTRIVKADADYVRGMTGYAIGGVPAVGHREALTTIIDRDLLQYDTIWAAAGTPHSVCEIPSHELAALTGGRVADIA